MEEKKQKKKLKDTHLNSALYTWYPFNHGYTLITAAHPSPSPSSSSVSR